MKLKTKDPSLETLFDPSQKPDEKSYHTEDNDTPTDSQWISQEGFKAQAQFLWRLDTNKQRRKLKRTVWRG